jgi:hypothetical protein
MNPKNGALSLLELADSWCDSAVIAELKSKE